MSFDYSHEREQDSSLSPLAIVGMGCRFPGGVRDVDGFWKMLTEERDGIQEVPANRWDMKRYFHADSSIPGAVVSKWGGFVDQLDRFDAAFWGISPREALRMDPQQRWLLEVAWEALENSGTPPSRLRGRNVGVFVGIAANDYAGLQMPYHEQTDAYTNSGSTLSIASNRISYMLDLRGPSISMDTACSSALVAVWTACRSIWNGSCESALTGGVNAVITPHASIGFSKASMLSPNGRCFAFDARANGYVRGEGAGMVFIKPLAQAVADNDRIYAVIRSAVSNQDGHTSSMTVPGIEGQSAMLRQAYQEAGLAASRVAYMEAHGTGTPVGDPIETTALGLVLNEGRPKNEPCLIGSVKTNIGHLEAGSGAAGLIKAALVLHNDTVPKNLNYETPNPNIPFETLGLRVADKLQPLPHRGELPAIVGVNSFGFGGANAHVVLEQWRSPAQALSTPLGHRAQRPFLLPISARHETSLRRYGESYRHFLEESAHSLDQICYSAGARKEHHPMRLAVMGNDKDDIRRKLAAWLRKSGTVDGVITGRVAHANPAIVFVFTGQGAQWWAMGRELLGREPVFRRTVEQIDRLLTPLAGWSLLEEMTRPETESNIDRTDVAQPAIFALQVALTELWKSWGVTPAKVIGHSVGEVAAAYCAGVYSLEDAVTVIYHRSRLQNTTGGHGRMLAVGVAPAEARQFIGNDNDRVEIAVFNGPNLVTLSGDTEPLEQIATKLEQAGKFHRWLRIAYAFHTHQMDPIRDELLLSLSGIRPRLAAIPFISTVTGGMLMGDRLDAMYWWRNVRQPVLFAPAIAGLIRGREDTFLEIGPHPALASSVTECLKEQGKPGAVYHSLKRDSDESTEMLANLAGLHTIGVDIDWAAVNQSAGPFVDLPYYPWNYESYWLESKESAQIRVGSIDHPLLGDRMPSPLPTWQVSLHPGRLDYLNDHRFWDSIVFPGAGYAEMGLAVARRLFPDAPHAVEDLEIKKALFLDKDRPPSVQIVFEPETKEFSVFSSADEKQTWELNAHGRLTRMTAPEERRIDPAQLCGRLTDHLDHEAYYSDMAQAGYQFGPNFQEVQNVWRVPGEALAEIAVPPAIAATVGDYHFQPAVMDACFHIFKGLKLATNRPEEEFYLPQAIRRVFQFGRIPANRIWAHGKLTLDDGKSLIADIAVYDADGLRVADILGFRVDRIEQRKASDDVDQCYYRWEWEPRRLRTRGIDGACGYPPTEAIVATTRTHAADFYREYSLDKYHGPFTDHIEAISRQFTQNAWLALGWSPSLGQQFTSSQVIQSLGIVEAHHTMARAQLCMLQEAGIVRPLANDAWEVTRLPERSDALADLEKLATEFPAFMAEINLHRQVGPNLARVLSGEADSVEILFPGGSFELLERFYAEAGDVPSQTKLIRLALTQALKALPPRRFLRVLEIGAGTGSLSRVVLPVLPADRTEYLFTDIGPAFLTSAKKAFAHYPFIEYRVFDVEKDLASQGIEPGSYDLVLASHVLHATSDVARTLSTVRACLADGGLLLFSEMFSRRLSWNNIFGMLKDWWKFTDTHLRQTSPLLERKQWIRLLEEGGFVDANSFGTSIDENHDVQAVFLALKPPGTPQPPDSRADATKPIVIFADRGGTGDSVAERLRTRGHRVFVIRAGSTFARTNDLDYVVGPTEEDLRRVVECLPVTTDQLGAIIHFWSLDHPEASVLDLDALWQAQQTGVYSAFRLARVLAKVLPPRVLFVTRDMLRVFSTDACTGLATSPIVGFARVASNEFFPCRFAVIDLANPAESDEVEDLMHEAVHGDDEHEIGYRSGKRYVIRFRRAPVEQLPARRTNAVKSPGSVTPYRLQIDKPGILTNLSLNETRRRDPQAHEVEVRIQAGGINFRDVMKALGHYPGNPIDLLWFGDDFSGTVERVGTGVTHVRPGDRVAGMAPYSFRSFSTIDARMVFKLAAHISFEEAATLPTVYLTSHYALNHLAHMQKGESILIHAGTGGVGQAAIQIAQRLGLEIFATAGSVDKRQMLRDMGVPHVLNSRTLEFADEIMAITQGRGVDAVLNSLAGDFIPKSFSVLAPFGRFLEIGKIDIYKNSKLGMEALRNNISYFVIDLAQHLLCKPDFMAKLFAELGERFATGQYKPLTYKVFPITQVVEAFRYMAQGKHVGKNVLSFDVPEIPIGPCTESEHRFRADASYLISGGAGGFGLEVVKWMARHGARNFALLSRSGPREENAVRDIENLRSSGVAVLDLRGDVTCMEDVRRAVADVAGKLPPLRGVIHGAMVLDDEFISVLDEQRFAAAFAPKMAGAWNLHAATLDLPLEHFIGFSSYSSLLGIPKQSSYNAGNYFLDALAAYRHGLGLPALTINWGPLLGAGFVERNRKTADFLEKIGARSFDMAEAVRVFGRLTLHDPVQVGASRINWRAMASAVPLVGHSKTFAALASENAEGKRGGSLAARLQASPHDARPNLIADFISIQVAGVFGVAEDKVDREVPLTSLGLDSLMAVELTNRIEREIGLAIPMGSLLGGPSIHTLSQTVLRMMASTLEGEAGAEANASVTAGTLPFEKLAVRGQEFPLSEGQKALWYMYRLDPKSSAYNLTFCGKFRPLADIDAMRRAFAALFDIHPMLDVTFNEIDGQPVQKMGTGGTIDFREHDVRGQSDAEVNRQVVLHASVPFNLETGPVVRLELFKTQDDAHVALLCMHHIIADAWSVALLINDLIEAYFACRSGRQPDLKRRPFEYQDFVAWEAKHLASPAGKKTAEFWKRQLKDAPMALDLPIDRPRPPVQTFNGATLGFVLDDDLSQKALAIGAEQNATLFMTALAVFQITLHRITRQDDLLIGVPLAGRQHREVQPIVGYFVNPLPIRSRIDDNPTFVEFLKRTTQATAQAMDNQQFPMPHLVRLTNVPRDPSRSPIFQVLFAMERVPGVDEQGVAVFMVGTGGHKFYTGDVSMESMDLRLRQTQFELTLVIEEAGGRIYGCWQYNIDLFDPATIARLNEIYAQTMREALRSPLRRISELDIVPESQRSGILRSLNNTQRPYRNDLCLHQLFEEQVDRSPDTVAVVFENQSLTYRQLDMRANRLAHRLRRVGVQADTLVAVCADRSLEMIVALYGILKAGGAYVPLDPTYPKERLAFMLADADAPVLLTQAHLVPMLSDCKAQAICLDRDWTEIEKESADRPAPASRPDSLAYMIYTSGSTGQPKGALIEHLSICNRLQWMQETYRLTPADRVLQKTPFSFDVSVWEFFWPLITGARLVVARPEGHKDSEYLVRTIREHGITVLHFVPSMLQVFLGERAVERCTSLRQVICSGEALSADLQARFFQTLRCPLDNLYGPTEAAVDVTWWSCRSDDTRRTVPIGRPVANTQIWVLDERGHPTPVGVAGELHIGGVQVGRGYWNRPELTAEKFIPDPFSPEPNARLYKTGDLARILPEGVIEFLGRMDFQVKLRGFRVELGEIEAVLRAHAAVTDAVVVHRQDLSSGDPYLAAYVVPRGESKTLPADLLEHLKLKLPEYMVPASIMALDSLPLSPNGKVDRKALPMPERASDREFVEPRTETERQVADIWKQVLGVERVGVHDDFFALGGHSLTAIRLLAQLRSAAGLNIPVSSLLRTPTVAGVARLVDAAAANESPAAEVEAIDFEAEARLSLEDVPASVAPIQAAKFEHALLTGATGFLGAFLLDELLRTTNACVHCLVRADSAEEGRDRIVRNLRRYGLEPRSLQARIHAVVGDLEKPLLGLTHHEFDELADKIDVIFHNGAIVNLVYPYSLLRASNVEGTRQILRLAALKRTKAVHFVSTVTVMTPRAMSAQSVVREADPLPNPGELLDGYAQSKWVAERLVREAARRGVPVTIFRPGQVTGHSRTGVCNPQDFLHTLVLACSRIGWAPMLDLHLDLTPVDYVSQGIVRLARRPDSAGKVFHLVNPNPLAMNDLTHWMQRDGLGIRSLPYVEWRRRLEELVLAAPDELLAPLMELLGPADAALPPYWPPQFDSRQAVALLSGAGVNCPPADDRLLRTYFGFLSRAGLIQRHAPANGTAAGFHQNGEAGRHTATQTEQQSTGDLGS